MSENKIITFGCRLNSFESEIIRNSANQANVSNAIIFNTCAVTQEAERQARQAIRKAKKEFPDKEIIVTGCAAQLNPERYSLMPEVSKVLGNEEKLQAKFYESTQNKIQVDDIMTIKETAPHLITNLEGKTRAFVQIQNGCNHRCTFCTIPFARGNNRSVPVGVIVNQIKTLIENGYKEIVFTGVDITDYGKDLPAKPTLAQMTKRLLTLVPELQRLRFSSIDVAEIDSELMELFITESKIMPHFHISLQAGDNMILKRMKRRHNREQIIDFCHTVKRRRPESAFGADIIAGFPTETEEMFINTKNVINEAKIPYLHVFPFSSRENTPASKMKQIPKLLRKERAAILRYEGDKQLHIHLQSMIGKNVEALVENKNMARSNNFSHINLKQDFSPGELVNVRLTNLHDNILEGELI